MSTTTTSPVAIDHLGEQVAAFRAIDQQIKDLEEMRDRVKQAIVDALGEHDAGTVSDRVVVRRIHYVQHRLSTTLVRKRFTEDELSGCYQDIEVNRVDWPTR